MQMANTQQDRFGDERLKKSAGDAVRGSRDGADVDRVSSDGTSLSAAERRRLLRQEWVQTILPQVPELPGYHLCWVSTTNGTDPIYKRLQVGYTPVKATEVPGFDQYKVVSDNEFNGCIACNEMLLFKIPMQVYQDLMAIFHNDMPLEQEQAIRERVSNANEFDSNGRPLLEMEGDFNQLGRQSIRNPVFQ
jgi:hypothetical protein